MSEKILTPMFFANVAFSIEHLEQVSPETRQALIGKLLKLSEDASYAEALLVAWKSAPNELPEPFNDVFYREQYGVPVLLHDGEKIIPHVACWCFGENGWVGYSYCEGPNPSDYDWLNDKPMKWLALSDVGAP